MVPIRETYVGIGQTIDHEENLRLDEILSGLGPDEKIVFTMNRADAHEADELIAYLEGKGYTVQPKGGHEDDYYLHVWREVKGKDK